LLDECGLASAAHWYAEGFQKRSGIQVKVEVAEDLPRLNSDAETTLFRVVQESLTNVHRYSGSSVAIIRISASNGRVCLEVIDRGKGMSTEKARVAVDGVAPLGVGIPGMRERLHQLGGDLAVDFAPTGTRVLATLPFRAANAENASELDTSLQEIAKSAAEPRRRILIADDHELMRRGLRGLLESHYEWAVCGEAIEGREAVRKAEELEPDLVIMDVNLPGLTGIQAAARILSARPQAKIVFFTVHDSEEIIRGIVDSGAHGYVSKARAGHDLVDAVHAVLNGGTFFPHSVAAAAHRWATLWIRTPCSSGLLFRSEAFGQHEQALAGLDARTEDSAA